MTEEQILPVRAPSLKNIPEGFTSDVDIAYAAGFFDGEGHCGTRINKAPNGKFYAIVHVNIGQNSRGVLDWFASFWGGNIYSYKDKEQHQWSIVGTRAQMFLEQILPSCKVKQEQIQETFLAYQENRKSAPRQKKKDLP